MKTLERRQLRVNHEQMKPLEQLAFEEMKGNTYICPYCCGNLVEVGRKLPENCPECGQSIYKK